ncbi:uncharacterized protein LOC119075760 [Bradysia coprophila]|uniref:uncharacterized protein LOC119075760 n=1 Tax=Bradysia coprophila TaxID=38358 RepID=UPI00187DB396|nr:uncharacterized protein LOC119075760 [Bradysia coprophila]
MASSPVNDALPVFRKHAAFNANVSSFEELMIKGEAQDTWVGLCEKVGQFLATTRKNFGTEGVEKVFPNVSIGTQSVLGEWIKKVNNSWDDSLKTIIPARRMNDEISERMRARGMEAAKLMENTNFVNLGNLLTKNVQLLSGQPDVQVNFAATELVEGPLGLDTALFLADVLIKYHQLLRLEHNIRYVTSDCAKSFGRAFDEEMNSNEADQKKYWNQTSFLTGWEIIRRATEDQALLERSQHGEVELVDVFEAGLRLVSNRNIDNINFMIVVALAEIF